MEPNVWTQLFVQVVNFLFNRSASSSNPESQNSGGVLPSAPESAAATTSTSTNATILAVVRDPKLTTMDGLIGKISYNGEFICDSIERTAVAIKEGTYSAKLDMSPHMGYICPHLKVPERDMAAGGDAGIRIHVANRPDQLEGCIATGMNIDGDALDSSKVAFDKLMAVLPQEFTVVVSSLNPTIEQ